MNKMRDITFKIAESLLLDGNNHSNSAYGRFTLALEGIEMFFIAKSANPDSKSYVRASEIMTIIASLELAVAPMQPFFEAREVRDSGKIHEATHKDAENLVRILENLITKHRRGTA